MMGLDPFLRSEECACHRYSCTDILRTVRPGWEQEPLRGDVGLCDLQASLSLGRLNKSTSSVLFGFDKEE